MKTVNPFDTRLEATKRMPDGMRDAAVFLTDTLDLCWAAAQAVFQAKAQPSHALELLPMFIERAKWEAARQLAAARDQTVDESAAPVPSLSSRPLG